jgi:hypothetical protein
MANSDYFGTIKNQQLTGHRKPQNCADLRFFDSLAISPSVSRLSKKFRYRDHL